MQGYGGSGFRAQELDLGLGLGFRVVGLGFSLGFREVRGVANFGTRQTSIRPGRLAKLDTLRPERVHHDPCILRYIREVGGFVRPTSSYHVEV